MDSRKQGRVRRIYGKNTVKAIIRYWQDGDFISKRRYSKKERYAIPYNGEEVYLYWANHDQYYIKTGDYFTDYTWKAPNGVTVHFNLKAADVEQNNVKGEKRFFLPRLDEIAWDEEPRTLTIPFEFRPLTQQEQIAYGQKNQQEVIIARSVTDIPKRLATAGKVDVSSANIDLLSANTNVSSAPEPHKGWYSRGRLPHFDAAHTYQFITFRLHDSVPAEVIAQWKAELHWTEQTQPHSKEAIELRKRIEKYEDSGYGACYLRDERIAALVENALKHFDGQRYHLVAWCIMPNHVHVLIQQIEGHSLPKVIHSWKSYTAHEANKLLKRSGDFWMPDYFDRFIRDEKHFMTVVEYIHQNPVKAGLVSAPQEWPWSSAARGGASAGNAAGNAPVSDVHGGGKAGNAPVSDVHGGGKAGNASVSDVHGGRDVRDPGDDDPGDDDPGDGDPGDSNPGDGDPGDGDPGDSRVACLKAHPSLPLDTRHFPPDFTDRLLASFDPSTGSGQSLDEMTDGLLVHSENWQALNLLHVETRRVYAGSASVSDVHGGRDGRDSVGRYLIYRGITHEGQRAVVIWRETENWTKEH